MLALPDQLMCQSWFFIFFYKTLHLLLCFSLVLVLFLYFKPNSLDITKYSNNDLAVNNASIFHFFFLVYPFVV